MRNTVLLMASMALAVLLVCGVALAATVECVRGAELCDGTDEADTLKGTPEKDTMRGLEGNDKLYAKEGDDEMSGGPGNDLMRGGRGFDNTLLLDVPPEAPPDEATNAGDDTIYGGDGNDWLIDREGRNLLSGGDGDDMVLGTGTVLGDRGNDLLHGSSVEDAEGNVVFKGRAIGGSGEDLVRVIGTGTMLGGPGDDAFDKRPCRDRCRPPTNGEEGPRVLRGGAGNDVLRLFGAHDDTIYLTDGERDRVVSCGPGADTIYFDRGLDKIRAGASCGERHPR